MCLLWRKEKLYFYCTASHKTRSYFTFAKRHSIASAINYNSGDLQIWGSNDRSCQTITHFCDWTNIDCTFFVPRSLDLSFVGRWLSMIMMILPGIGRSVVVYGDRGRHEWSNLIVNQSRHLCQGCLSHVNYPSGLQFSVSPRQSVRLSVCEHNQPGNWWWHLKVPKALCQQLLGIISILFIIVVELPYGARIELHLMEVEVYEQLNELQATFQPEEQEIEYSCDFS